MAKAQQPDKVSFRERLKQIGMVFAFTAKRDRRFIPLVIVAAAVPLILAGLAVWLLGSWLWLAIGFLFALLAVTIVLNLRSNTAMMAEAETVPGAAASIMEQMRGDWRVTPAVQMTTQNDFVHRVLGRPGVILVGEGAPGRVRGLLGQEKRRLSKVVGDAPIYDFIIGHGDDEVPIRRLRSALMKLPRNLTGKQVNGLDTRLRALSARPAMPKGPIPKNLRPRGAMRMTRGR